MFLGRCSEPKDRECPAQGFATPGHCGRTRYVCLGADCTTEMLFKKGKSTCKKKKKHLSNVDKLPFKKAGNFILTYIGIGVGVSGTECSLRPGHRGCAQLPLPSGLWLATGSSASPM